MTRGQVGVIVYRILIGLDTTKMQDYRENVSYAKGENEPSAILFSISTHETAGKTLTLKEDWSLTSDLDWAVPGGDTLTIDGQGKFHLYEMGGMLQNSAVGTVTFTGGTILYPEGNSWTDTSDQLMVDGQAHTVTVDSGISNGTITTDLEKAKKDEIMTLTVTPAKNYELDTLTVTDENGAKVVVNNRVFTMPASNVTINATFKQSATTPSGGGSSSNTTTTTNKATGTVMEITKNPDGSTLVIETKKDGTVTTTNTAENGVKTVTADEIGKNVTATVTIPDSVGTATVTIPADVVPGTVAIDAKTGEIIKLSIPTGDGLTIKLDGSTDLILVDKSKDFTDTAGHWAAV